jgi:pyruvate formate lyase activating enzyme
MKLPEIRGFIDLSLVDWDGKVSAVIFLPYCNFRCPFCYNTNLVLKPEEMKLIDFAEVETYLRKNLSYLDGVVITGGEPTIHKELPELCKQIKHFGFIVKLDTNGTNSSVTQHLVEDKLVDYVALDIKTILSSGKYSEAVGVNAESLLKEVVATSNLLMQSSVDYEFRTTLVPTIHDDTDVKQICQKIKGCKKYVLQNFKSGVDTLDPKLKAVQPFSPDEMQSFLELAKKIVANTVLR